MIATILLCLLLIIVLLGVMMYVGWPIALAVVVGMIAYKVTRRLLSKRS